VDIKYLTVPLDAAASPCKIFLGKID